jgi:hypothetical protein
MRVRAEISYPTGSPNDVFELATSEPFRSAVCIATRAHSHSVDIQHKADGRTSVVVERTLPAQVPDAVKRFVGETITIVQTEDWGPPRADGGRRADLVIDIVGQPARMTGTVTLEPTGQGARELVDGELKVSVPFFGKQIEPSVAEAIVAAAAIEEATGREWLSRSG